MTTIQQGQAYDALPRIAHALTGIEASLRSIDGHLNRLANLSEAGELRQRRFEEQDQQAQNQEATITLFASPVGEESSQGLCSMDGCENPAVAIIQQQGVCREHLDIAFQRVRESFTKLRAVIDPEEKN